VKRRCSRRHPFGRAGTPVAPTETLSAARTEMSALHSQVIPVIHLSIIHWQGFIVPSHSLAIHSFILASLICNS